MTAGEALTREAGEALTREAFEARLAELARVEEGWLDCYDELAAELGGYEYVVEHDHRARAASPEVLEAVGQVLAGRVEALGLPWPHLFLMPTGGIEAMWRGTGRTVLLLFEGHLVRRVLVDMVERKVVEPGPPGRFDSEVDNWLAEVLRG